MDNYCAFSKDHHCLKWNDYEMARHELDEADSLCHGNWIEIEELRNYIKELQLLLEQNGIEYTEK